MFRAELSKCFPVLAIRCNRSHRAKCTRGVEMYRSAVKVTQLQGCVRTTCLTFAISFRVQPRVRKVQHASQHARHAVRLKISHRLRFNFHLVSRQSETRFPRNFHQFAIPLYHDVNSPWIRSVLNCDANERSDKTPVDAGITVRYFTDSFTDQQLRCSVSIQYQVCCEIRTHFSRQDYSP